MEGHRGRLRPGDLLERRDELEAIDRALGEAINCQGGVLLVEGPSGIGKTALLRAGYAIAQRREMVTLSARGAELERHFPYGVARQLFEPVLRQASAPERRRLLSGAAGLASPIVAGQDEHPRDGAASADPAFAFCHGLHWLAINICQKAPTLVTVDDAQWADRASLLFLLYLARRLEGLPLSVLIASRSDEPGTDLDIVAQLRSAAPGLRVITPASLSEHAIAQLIQAGLSQAPDRAFTAACAAATGGSPFFVHELLAALAAEGIEPTAQAAPRAHGVGPPTVARATIMRLGRMSSPCVALARSIAVLAGDAQLPHASRLAGLEQPEALQALDGLIAAQVVRIEAGLEFVHPIVRTAIYDELPPGERSELHRQAARLLQADGAELDAIAAQLLASEPSASLAVINTLREAARLALARGAPEDAIVYVSRALAEGCGRELRAALSFELATAERLAGRPTAIDHYEAAQRLAEDPVLRNTAALELAGLVAVRGEWDKTIALVGAALADLGDHSPELAIRLERLRAGTAAYDIRLVSEFEHRLPALRDLVKRSGAPGRSLALLLAAVSSFRGDVADVAALVERGWDGGHLLETEGEEWAPGQALAALVICDQLERASQLTGELMAAARARGSLSGYLVGTGYQGFIEARQGRLHAAEADLRAALDPIRERRLNFLLPSLLWFATDVIIERPQASDLAAVTEEVELGTMSQTLSGALLLQVRARVRHAAGDRTSAIRDLRSAGETCRTLGVRHPSGSSWRSTLALMLGPDEHREAQRLAADELQDALEIGQARAVGVALTALGLLEGGANGRVRLERAARTLEASPARLEQARALIELGAAMRRGGERAAAREPLRKGLDLATVAGASCLSERASSELAATGAHPRRTRVTGRDALTPSELRVARLAAEGQTNNEIAQALFITPKTVDTHLTHAYAKLGISSRRLLATALDPSPGTGASFPP